MLKNSECCGGLHRHYHGCPRKKCATSIDGDAAPNQRAEGGSSPTVALFHKEDWIVAEVPLAFAQRFTEEHHYSGGGSNTRVVTTGLFQRGRVCKLVHPAVGITWWIPPTKSAAKFINPANWQGVLACSRLAILDEIPRNAESFLLRHSMRFIDREKWRQSLSAIPTIGKDTKERSTGLLVGPRAARRSRSGPMFSMAE